jgi:hypothetical protein
LESSKAGSDQRGSSPGWKRQRPSSEATCSRPLSRSRTWTGLESATARNKKARQRVLRRTKDPRGGDVVRSCHTTAKRSNWNMLPWNETKEVFASQLCSCKGRRQGKNKRRPFDSNRASNISTSGSPPTFPSKTSAFPGAGRDSAHGRGRVGHDTPQTRNYDPSSLGEPARLRRATLHFDFRGRDTIRSVAASASWIRPGSRHQETLFKIGTHFCDEQCNSCHECAPNGFGRRMPTVAVTKRVLFELLTVRQADIIGPSIAKRLG